jgi:hypothetical protein
VDPPPQLYRVGSTVTVSLSCEAHPYWLEWEGYPTAQGPPAGPGFRCWTPGGNWANPCAGPLTFDQCGSWRVAGGCVYEFTDQSGSPYVNHAEAAVVVFGCEIFNDGFETGSTGEWSRTVP